MLSLLSNIDYLRKKTMHRLLEMHVGGQSKDNSDLSGWLDNRQMSLISHMTGIDIYFCLGEKKRSRKTVKTNPDFLYYENLRNWTKLHNSQKLMKILLLYDDMIPIVSYHIPLVFSEDYNQCEIFSIFLDVHNMEIRVILIGGLGLQTVTGYEKADEGQCSSCIMDGPSEDDWNKTFGGRKRCVAPPTTSLTFSKNRPFVWPIFSQALCDLFWCKSLRW
ncbi:uncharacterized protein DS421_7g221330 [Arachis hypogaea]|nr:uncharacterized protein DS421_7g221330 [Arachis hypogaea]